MPTLTDIENQLVSIRGDLTVAIADVHVMQVAPPLRKLLMCSIDGGPLHNPQMGGAQLVADYGGIPVANVGDAALFGSGMTFLQPAAQQWLSGQSGDPNGPSTASVAYDWTMLDSEKAAYSALRDLTLPAAARATLNAEHQKAVNYYQSACRGRFILWYGLIVAPESGSGAAGNDLAAEVANQGNAVWANCYCNGAPPFSDEIARQCRIMDETLRVSTKPVWCGVTPRFVDSCRPLALGQAIDLLRATMGRVVNGRKPERVAIWSADYYYLDYVGGNPTWRAQYQVEHAAMGLPFIASSRVPFCRETNKRHMAVWRQALDAI